MEKTGGQHVLFVPSRSYQEFVRQAATDREYAEYVCLLNACLEVLRAMPLSVEDVDIEELTAKALDALGDGIAQCLRDGWKEFRNYMPEGRLDVRI